MTRSLSKDESIFAFGTDFERTEGVMEATRLEFLEL